MTEWRTVSLRDKPFTVHSDEDISNAIIRDGDFYEHEILDYLAEKYPVQERIIDAGANIGNHTVFFSRFFRYTEIVAFEPDKDNYALLLNNLELNEVSSVMPIQGALTAHDGDINLFVNGRNYGAHQVSNTPGGESVAAFTLDSFGFTDVTLFKIDVEYHEPELLAGASKTIRRCKPLILIEDIDVTYGKFLPGYELLETWQNYRNYLYGWKND